MSLLQDVAALVRRSTQPSSPPSRPAEPAEQPATEQEVEAALARLDAERAAVEPRIRTAGERRDALLDDPAATEDDVLAAGVELDRDTIALERIDRAVVSLRARLAELRAARVRQQWRDDRQNFCGAMRPVFEAIKVYEAAFAAAVATRADLIARWPAAGRVDVRLDQGQPAHPAVPSPPPLIGSSAGFDVAMRDFARTELAHMLAPRPPLFVAGAAGQQWIEPKFVSGTRVAEEE